MPTRWATSSACGERPPTGHKGEVVVVDFWGEVLVEGAVCEGVESRVDGVKHRDEDLVDLLEDLRAVVVAGE